MKYFILFFFVLTMACSERQNKEIKAVPKDTVPLVRTPKIISDSTNVLEKKVQTIELEYTLWGCACPNWIRPGDAIKYADSGFERHHIYIEPGPGLDYPDSNFQIFKQNILVTGQFYVREDYPEGTVQYEEVMDKAKVFRYTKIKVVKK